MSSSRKWGNGKNISGVTSLCPTVMNFKKFQVQCLEIRYNIFKGCQGEKRTKLKAKIFLWNLNIVDTK